MAPRGGAAWIGASRVWAASTGAGPLWASLLRTGLLALALPGLAVAQAAAQSGAQSGAGTAPRTLVIGGTIAEIVVALGAEGQLVGRDATSTWPESLRALPDIGPMVQISAEGALALAPELILADPGVGPPAAVEVLQAAGVDYRVIPRVLTAEGVVERIEATAAVLGRPEAGAALVEKVQAELAEAAARVTALPEAARIPVLMVLSVQGGKVMTGGVGSTVDSLIALAGGVNAGHGINGYKVITDEAIVAAAPQVILISADTGGPYARAEEILAHPALAQTPAAREGRIVGMDGLLLLGFGLRTGEAVLQLNEILYGPPTAEGDATDAASVVGPDATGAEAPEAAPGAGADTAAPDAPEPADESGTDGAGTDATGTGGSGAASAAGPDAQAAPGREGAAPEDAPGDTPAGGQ